MKTYSTKGKTVPLITFKLDGVELRAYRPKRSLLMEIGEIAGIAKSVEGASEEDQQEAGLDIAQTCINLIPKVFDAESRAHLEARIFDPGDPFDIMPEGEKDTAPSLFGILGDLMDTLAGKDEGSAPTSPSRGGSRRPPKASTVIARSKAAGSTTASSRTKGSSTRGTTG